MSATLSRATQAELEEVKRSSIRVSATALLASGRGRSSAASDRRVERLVGTGGAAPAGAPAPSGAAGAEASPPLAPPAADGRANAGAGAAGAAGGMAAEGARAGGACAPSSTRSGATRRARDARLSLLTAAMLGCSWALGCTGARGSGAPIPGEPAKAPGGLAAADRSGPPDWTDVDAILARIREPTFPARQCDITNYGAVAGGESDATAAIGRAIADCAAQGGGRVLVPEGVFSTGAIHLDSNIDLHLVRGATLRFEPDPAAYLPVVLTRWEGIECMNYSPLIYARDEQNVAVTGEGTLDGSASEENWWRWAKRDAGRPSLASADVKLLNQMSEGGVPVEHRVFGSGHYLRPSFIQIHSSRNVLIEGVTIVRSPMWEIHPVFSENVTVRGVEIISHGPNNDGCNPDSSRDVLIENSVFDVGDDCIAIKSGRNEDGRRVARPVENIIVRGSLMRDGHAGVAIGSEVSGDARNIFIEDSRMDSPNLDRALRIKSNARRGGTVENVYFRNVTIGRVSEALLTVDFAYEEGPNGDHPPTARNIVVENVRAEQSPRLFFISGIEAATIDGIEVRNTQISRATATEVIEHAGNIRLENVVVTPATKARAASSRQLVE